MPRKSVKSVKSVQPMAPTAIPEPQPATPEAPMQAPAAIGVGIEAIGREVTDYAQASFENAGGTFRALLDARTLEDVIRLQTDLATRNFADWFATTAKLSELGLSLVSASVDSWGAR
ncbi:MAG TPA: phasin family protein [Schlesneria sp.]